MDDNLQSYPKTNHPYFKALSLTPDAEDYKIHNKNKSPDILTARLRELVPILDFTKTEVVKVENNCTELEMPLREEVMNQNGTHQASVFYLIADYTAGLAILGALPGIYVTGVNDRCHAYPVQYWTKQGKVIHLKPGTKTITTEARISTDEAFRMRQELTQNGVTELEVHVNIYENGKIIASATQLMGVYGDLPLYGNKKINWFQNQNANLSANMIAGLKSDRLSLQIANGLGKALATRFVYNTPELPEIIKSREASLDSFFTRHGEFQQILILGLGLDTRPNRSVNEHKNWFGVDLKGSIKQRKTIFGEKNIDDSMVIKVAANLMSDNWFDQLIESGFDDTKDSLVVMEGICMYLNIHTLYGVFEKLYFRMRSGNVLLWLDYVHDDLYTTRIESAKNFLENISRLGEPFISSESDIYSALTDLSFKTENISPEKCSQYSRSKGDIFELYGFMEIPIVTHSHNAATVDTERLPFPVFES